MKQDINLLKPFGSRVLVRKEKIDLGGLKGTPHTEESGMKNTGIIVATGQIGFLNWLRGIRVGQKIRFKKFFIADDESEHASVFVDVENIIGIEKNI